jgi:hypothetical protein
LIGPALTAAIFRLRLALLLDLPASLKLRKSYHSQTAGARVHRNVQADLSVFKGDAFIPVAACHASCTIAVTMQTSEGLDDSCGNVSSGMHYCVQAALP